jgi:hypothetical protein
MSGGAEGISASDFLREREKERAAKRMGGGAVSRRDEILWPSITVS